MKLGGRESQPGQGAFGRSEAAAPSASISPTGETDDEIARSNLALSRLGVLGIHSVRDPGHSRSLVHLAASVFPGRVSLPRASFSCSLMRGYD